MKAKEYAQLIVSDNTRKDELNKTLVALLSAVMTACSHNGKSVESKIAVVREQFTKWKAIVSQVKNVVPDYVIDVAYFPKLLGEFHPAMFAAAADNKVFLGYTLDAVDQAARQAGLNKFAEAERESMLRSLRSMGLR